MHFDATASSTLLFFSLYLNSSAFQQYLYVLSLFLRGRELSSGGLGLPLSQVSMSPLLELKGPVLYTDTK